MNTRAILFAALIALAVADRDGAYGKIEDGDRAGFDIDKLFALDAEDCQRQCYRNSACNTWSYDTCGSLSCWTKSQAGLHAPAGCRVSGVITARRDNKFDTCSYDKEIVLRGNNFFDFFNFPIRDTTNSVGRYVRRDEANSSSLISVRSNGQVYMGVDSTSVGQGRKTVRIETFNQIKYNMLILDLAHMPGSICGLWPAFWTFGPNWPFWPAAGEIDIIEGVNRDKTNSATLHTNGGCQFNGVGRDHTGSVKFDNCDSNVNGNSGCGVQVNKGGSYGDDFNRNGGGVYVMERELNGIRVWFFPRNAIPGDVLSGHPNPCNWGKPDAHFPLQGSCPSEKFGAQMIIFNIALCGDWAGGVFQRDGCGNDCAGWVANNPAAFKEAYWLINSMRILSR